MVSLDGMGRPVQVTTASNAANEIALPRITPRFYTYELQNTFLAKTDRQDIGLHDHVIAVVSLRYVRLQNLRTPRCDGRRRVIVFILTIFLMRSMFAFFYPSHRL